MTARAASRPDPDCESIPLHEYLLCEDAIIAPNLDAEDSTKLRRWLIEFQSSHGAGSVWVIPYGGDDDPPTTDRVLLVVPTLDSADKAMLLQLGADDVSAVGRIETLSLISMIAPDRRAYLAIWD